MIGGLLFFIMEVKLHSVEAQLRIKGWSAAKHADQSVRTNVLEIFVK